MDLRPRDLPDLVRGIVEFDRTYVADWADEVNRRRRDYEARNQAQGMREAARFLPNADLYYTTPEMWDLIDVAAQSLPHEFDVSVEDPPSRVGFVWAGRPVREVDRSGELVQPVAFSWTVFAEKIRIGLWVEIQSLEHRYAVLLRERGIRAAIAALGAVDMELPGGVHSFYWNETPAPGKSTYRRLHAFWLLSRQPMTILEQSLPDRAERRRARRDGHREPPPVRIVRLRQPPRPPSGESPTPFGPHRG